MKHIVDAYGSRSGSVAAVAAGQLVLADGHVITPSRSTAITLNGASATIEQIAVGDAVMVRYNIDSSEPREIIATRKTAAADAPAASVGISSIAVAPDRPLKAGDTLSVTMHGTPGGLAGYDIGPYVRNLTLTEAQPGVYTGSYTIARGTNFADAPVVGRLNARGVDAAAAQAPTTVSVSTVAPGISDFAPDSGTTVNNARPSVYATFSSDTVPVNPSSARLILNGHDVTSSSLRTQRFIDYVPGIDYPDGPVRVTVIVADQAGNTTTKSWTFYIRSR